MTEGAGKGAMAERMVSVASFLTGKGPAFTRVGTDGGSSKFPGEAAEKFSLGNERREKDEATAAAERILDDFIDGKEGDDAGGIRRVLSAMLVLRGEVRTSNGDCREGGEGQCHELRKYGKEWVSRLRDSRRDESLSFTGEIGRMGYLFVLFPKEKDTVRVSYSLDGKNVEEDVKLSGGDFKSEGLSRVKQPLLLLARVMREKVTPEEREMGRLRERAEKFAEAVISSDGVREGRREERLWAVNFLRDLALVKESARVGTKVESVFWAFERIAKLIKSDNDESFLRLRNRDGGEVALALGEEKDGGEAVLLTLKNKEGEVSWSVVISRPLLTYRNWWQPKIKWWVTPNEGKPGTERPSYCSEGDSSHVSKFWEVLRKIAEVSAAALSNKKFIDEGVLK